MKLPGLLPQVLISLLLLSCTEEDGPVQKEHTGYIQGTTFQIKYLVNEEVDFAAEIGEIFKGVDASVSTYDSTSLISAVNRGDTVTIDTIFLKVLKRSLEIAQETNGIFDPTVGPLLKYWGFGDDGAGSFDSVAVDSVLNFVGYRHIWIQGNKVAMPPGFTLNFNAIAQGFTVDLLAGMLENKGVENYMVEVGGEVLANGQNINENIWKLGIDKPSEKLNISDRLQAIVHLKDAALATSGSYRQFRVDSATGIKYSHTIDPRTGYPAKSKILSASIIGESCMDADAYATVCMALEVRQALEFINTKPALEAYFIHSNEVGEREVVYTRGFEKYLN